MSSASIPLSQLMNLEVAFHDREGRPLGENKVPAHYRAGVAMEITECPYAGSRQRHFKPMNVSALKQMTAHWPVVMAGFDALNHHCLQLKGANGITPFEFFRITVAGYLLPSYLFYRADDAVASGELPGEIAAIYKAALGMVTTAQVMLAKAIITGAPAPDAELDGRFIYDFADREGLFIGAQEVCAGPPHMIIEVLDIIAAKERARTPAAAPLPDLSDFFRYSGQAEEVLLTDFLFPLVFYFIAPPFLISELFACLRAPAEQSRAGLFIGDISMELQLLDIIAAVIDGLTPAQHEHINNGLRALFDRLAANGALTAQLFDIGDDEVDERESFRTQLRDFLARVTLGVASELNANDREVIVEALTLYLLLERKKLRVYADCQQRMNRELNRDGSCRLPDSIDIHQMYGRKLRDVLADFLAIKIENHLDVTIFQQRELRAEIR